MIYKTGFMENNTVGLGVFTNTNASIIESKKR